MPKPNECGPLQPCRETGLFLSPRKLNDVLKNLLEVNNSESETDENLTDYSTDSLDDVRSEDYVSSDEDMLEDLTFKP
jgi:hypothetical protein